MMHVQEYLRSGKTIDDLTTEFGIRVKHHEELPLVILNYHQIDSPKFHPIVRECRGLVLELGTWDIVARSFERFYNLGEDVEGQKAFDWDSFVAEEKQDGTMILLYVYEGRLMVNTRNTFGDGQIDDTGKTWRELVLECLHAADHGVVQHFMEAMLPGECFVFELCSQANRVVSYYPTPRLYLIGHYFGEIEHACVLRIGAQVEAFVNRWEWGMDLPCLLGLVRHKETVDPLFEGYVLKDSHGHRIKVKSRTWLELHHLRGQQSPKHLVPLILKGEKAEILGYFPDLREKWEELEQQVAELLDELEVLYFNTAYIKDRRELAAAIANASPFASIIFRMRDAGEKGMEALRRRFFEAERLVMKAMGVEG